MGETWQDHSLLSIALSFRGPANMVYLTFAFQSSCELPSSLLMPQTITSFSLVQDGMQASILHLVLRLIFFFFSLGPYSYGTPVCKYIIKFAYSFLFSLFFFFSNLILRLDRRAQDSRGKFLPIWQIGIHFFGVKCDICIKFCLFWIVSLLPQHRLLTNVIINQ